MRRSLGISLLFILCLGLFLALHMPLVHVLARVNLPDQLRFSDLQGSLLMGRVDVLEVNQIQLTNVQYKSQPSCLLTLSWCYQLEFDQGFGLLSANLLDQSLNFSDANITYPAIDLARLSPQLLVRPTGDISIKLDNFKLENQKLMVDKGVLNWSHAGIEGESFDLGEYQLSVESVNDTYQFVLVDNQAELDVDGKGQLKSNGQYLLNVNIKSNTGLNSQIKGALDLIARKRGLNQYSMQNSGKLGARHLKFLAFY